MIISTSRFTTKNIALVLVLIVPYKITFGQDSADISFVESFIANFNRKNFSSIYNSTSNEFQKKVSRENFLQIFSSVYEQAGTITTFQFSDKPSNLHTIYLLYCEKLTLVLTLSLDREQEGIAKGLLLRPYRPNTLQFQSPANKISRLLHSWQNDSLNQGIVIGIIRNGKSEVQYLGYSDLKRKQKIHSETVFEIGSISKPISGIILQSLIIEGQLSIEDRVNKFLPDTIQLPTINGEEILLKHLVTHSSCLPRLPSNFGLGLTNLSNPYQSYTVENLYHYINNATLSCEIGKHIEYSNLGAGLLGLILIRASGKSYNQLVNKYISTPLNALSIGILNQSNNFATGHDFNGNIQIPWEFTDAFIGAGGIDATPSALEKFLLILIKPDSSKLGLAIKQSKETLLKSVQEIGTFWYKQRLNEKQIIWHNGQTGGFNSFIGWIDGSQSGVFVLSNNSTNIATELGMSYLEELALSD